MADTNIGKAYVQIIPKAEGIEGQIEDLISPAAEESGASGGKSLGKALIGGLAKAGLVAGVGKLFKDSLGEGANLQQSFGGLDTIYGDASEAAKEYAYMAAEAGISANDYAEQAVSFGASLKQAFGGDTNKAVEAANTAIMDMTDNAAKMGTPIENIQNAYQGFAKQNYTMLDNLKLGYGGTKEEMERLLADASKLSGQEYDISNLGDVYDAIHVIQEDLGLTGVAAEEASSTFSGSFGAMKAAAANVLGNLALGKNIGPSLRGLGDTIKTFLIGNALPMIGNVVSQIPTVLAQLPAFIGDILPDLVAGIADIVAGLGQGIIDNIPVFVASIGQMFNSLWSAVTSIDYAGIANSLLTGLTTAIGGIWDSVTELLSAEFGIELPDWETVVENISELWENVKTGIAEFFKTAFAIVMDDDKTITEKISALWDLVKESIGDFFKAAFDIILPAAETIIDAISTWWGDNVWPSIQDFFKTTFGIEIPDWETVTKTISEGWDTLKTNIAEMFKVLFGIEIPSWEEIKETVSQLWEDFKGGISSWFKTKFKVNLPTWSDIQEDIKAGWDEVKKGIGNIFSWVFSLDFPDIDTIVQDLKDWWDSVVKGVGDFFTLKWIFGDETSEEEGAKHVTTRVEGKAGMGGKFELGSDTVSIDSEAIQKALSDANLTLADVDTTSIDKAKEAVVNAISAMESAFSNAKLSLPTVQSESMQAASQVISLWVAAFKRLMKFSWTLPTLHGHLPVISVNMKSASSSDGKTTVSYPELSVNSFKWFGKGGIFDAPSVIGIGEAGPEAVVPLDPFWKRMSAIENQARGTTIYQTFNVDGSQDPEQWATGAARTLKRELRMA